VHACQCDSVRKHFLNLRKKISIPQDVMMEELNLLSNRGSRMFQERLRRMERFTVENADFLSSTEGQEAQHCNKENPAGKSRMVNTLRQTVARKGKPSVLAPGYSGPLKEMPPEKFNVTVIPKSYSSPWQPDVRDLDSFVASISACLPDPPFKLMPASYKCFNRSVHFNYPGHACKC
uniref:Uncharacterized protein n=1 Tax=Denticeps clupeoides TaxID=299321 RepID=A0AAY4BHY7_9TELE